MSNADFPGLDDAFILLPEVHAPNTDGGQDPIQKTDLEPAVKISWEETSRGSQTDRLGCARTRSAQESFEEQSYQLTAVSAERLLILAHTRSKPNSRQYNHKEALNGKRGERIKGRGQRKKALQTAGLVKVDSGLTERRNKTRRARENPQVVRPGGTPRSE